MCLKSQHWHLWMRRVSSCSSHRCWGMMHSKATGGKQNHFCFPGLPMLQVFRCFFTQLFMDHSLAICDAYLIIRCNWMWIKQFRFITIQNMPKVPQSVCQLLGRPSQNVTTGGEVRLCGMIIWLGNKPMEGGQMGIIILLICISFFYHYFLPLEIWPLTRGW